MNISVNLPWRTKFPAARRVRALTTRALDQSDIDVLIDQTNRFDEEIRVALRSTTTAVAAGLVVLTLGASVVKDVSRDVGLIALFPLLALAVTIHSQVAADVAVMAEVRDRLATIVNQRKGYPLLSVRTISDVRRFSPGTIAINGALSLAVAGAGGLMLAFAWRHTEVVFGLLGGKWYFAILLILMTLSIAAVLIAITDQGRGRAEISKHLDDIFGCDSRPDHLVEQPHSACGPELTPKLSSCPFYVP